MRVRDLRHAPKLGKILESHKLFGLAQRRQEETDVASKQRWIEVMVAWRSVWMVPQQPVRDTFIDVVWHDIGLKRNDWRRSSSLLRSRLAPQGSR